MARMTENMNLQQALYKRIDEIGKGVVDIQESSRVSEMREGDGGRWVGLRISEDKWVRGSLIVSARTRSPLDCWQALMHFDRSVQTDQTRL